MIGCSASNQKMAPPFEQYGSLVCHKYFGIFRAINAYNIRTRATLDYKCY